jgi:hypothetical protein
MATGSTTEKKPQPFAGLPDQAIRAAYLLLFMLVIVAMTGLSSLFMDDQAASYDTGRFFSMAQVIIDGATPYVDYEDPKTPLVFFVLTLPLLAGQKFLGGLLLVNLCNLASAALVARIARELYSRRAALFAGLLFLVNLGWAQGYFVMTEPFAVLFLMLATYFTICGKNKHYFLAGLSAGIAIGFKQYALIIVPALLLLLCMERQMKRIPALLAGIAVPLLVIFGSIFAVYGAQATSASLYWSFGVAGPYIARADVNGVLCSNTYVAELALNVVIALAMAVLLATGLAKVRKVRKLSVAEAYLLASGAGFALTLLIRQYLHYWALAIPFFAILFAGWLSEINAANAGRLAGKPQPAPCDPICRPPGGSS